MPNGQADPALLAALRIRYQPIIRLVDARMVHAEVLVRAAGDDGIMRGAASVLQGMTGSGATMDLTTAIIRRSMAEYRAYDFDRLGIALAFNLPLDAMLHPDLLAQIAALRAAAGLAASRLSFELTETSPVQNLDEAAASIRALHSAGHDIALDDITPQTPYLAALMNLPINAIKFGHDLLSLPGAMSFIRSMAALANARGLISIAEGIETQTQLAEMQAAGVTHGQGYLFSHPLPASELENFVQTRHQSLIV